MTDVNFFYDNQAGPEGQAMAFFINYRKNNSICKLEKYFFNVEKFFLR